MRILWIPHGTLERKVRQRDQYFIDRLKKNNEIHIITWTEPKGPQLRYFIDPVIHIKAYQNWDKKNEVYNHHFRRLCLSRFNSIRKINEYFFQKKIKEIVKENDINVVICGPNYYLNGFPPFDLDIPIIFDYSDYISSEHIKKTYLENSDIVLCVSNVMYEEAKEDNQNSYYLPNGVDIKKFRDADPKKVKSKFDLNDSRIVSLIGLTCAESFYFLDAFPVIKDSLPELKYLVVGDTYLLPVMKKKAKAYRNDIIFTGWIDYSEIHYYFAASDVGIYPVDKNIYFDSASPIKIFEYTAVGKPIVSTDLKELRHLNFPNILFSDPNVDDFAIKVNRAFNNKPKMPDLREYDWNFLTKKLENILKNII